MPVLTEQQVVQAALTVYARTGKPVTSREIYTQLANGQEPSDEIQSKARGWLANLGRKFGKGEATPIVRVIDSESIAGWVPANEAVDGVSAAQIVKTGSGVATKFAKRKTVKVMVHQTCVFERVVLLEYLFEGAGYIEQPSFGDLEIFMLPNVEFLNAVQAKARKVLKIRITTVDSNDKQVQTEQSVPANYWVIVTPHE
jgi:hypothetical protein